MALPDEVWGRDAYLETVYIVRRNTRCHSAQTPIYRKLGSEPERRGSRVRLRAERAVVFLYSQGFFEYKNMGKENQYFFNYTSLKK